MLCILHIKKKTLVRLHGRNTEAWKKPAKGEKWREIRYLYDYNDTELKEWEERVRTLEKTSENIYVVFNNNSGRHAAPNAKRFLELSDISYDGLAPRQISLFDQGDFS